MTPEDARRVRERAARLLRESGAAGVFPTPVDAIVEHTKLTVEEENLEPGFLAKIRRGLSAPFKQALEKVRALLHFAKRLILVGRDEPPRRRPWLMLHEAGHWSLEWQRDAYGLTEDCERSLDPAVTERFEREANYTATVRSVVALHSVVGAGFRFSQLLHADCTLRARRMNGQRS